VAGERNSVLANVLRKYVDRRSGLEVGALLVYEHDVDFGVCHACGEAEIAECLFFGILALAGGVVHDAYEAHGAVVDEAEDILETGSVCDFESGMNAIVDEGTLADVDDLAGEFFVKSVASASFSIAPKREGVVGGGDTDGGKESIGLADGQFERKEGFGSRLNLVLDGVAVEVD
jgi:hypothetical protein